MRTPPTPQTHRTRLRGRGPARAAAVCLAASTAVVLAGVPPAAAAVGLAPPVQGPVVATFDAPTRYGPGHRGVDLAAEVGTDVRASGAGTVTFAGRVVDATWVTVDHGAVRTTVGPLGTVTVRRGQRVVRGEVVGTSGRAHGRAAVHWSLRRGDTYLDPLAAGLRVATLLPDRSGRRDGPGRDRGAAATVTRPTTSQRPPPHWPPLPVRRVR